MLEMEYTEVKYLQAKLKIIGGLTIAENVRLMLYQTRIVIIAQHITSSFEPTSTRHEL